jgi:3-oxoacyl-[acyl-carrier protein] reductase
MVGSRFEGKVALVTGGGQGIGQAAAFRFASEGAMVGVLDRNEETATATVLAIREMGGSSMALCVDVADAASVRESVGKLRAHFGGVHILVNNAGFDRPGGFLKVSADDFRAVLEVHLMGAVNGCQACGPLMIEQGDGRIVNVSSIYAKIGSKGEAAYCSAKAGLIGLTKSLAREWGSKGVRVNAVLPGLTETPTILKFMHPKFRDAIIAETALGRAAEPEEIAAPIAFLASDDASFITGAVLEVAGGWSL